MKQIWTPTTFFQYYLQIKSLQNCDIFKTAKYNIHHHFSFYSRSMIFTMVKGYKDNSIFIRNCSSIIRWLFQPVIHVLFIYMYFRVRMHTDRTTLIKDQRYRFRLYPTCFCAQDAVTWLVKTEQAPERFIAVALVNILLDHNILHQGTRWTSRII